MGWRIQKRIKLCGGLGLNLSKSGVSTSVRTPFGSINSKGGYSIRTGIPGLFYRENGKSSSKSPNEAVCSIADESTALMDQLHEVIQRHEVLKRLNNEEILYDSDATADAPINRVFYSVLNELTDALELADYCMEKLSALIIQSGQHRTGITSKLREVEKQIQPCIREMREQKQQIEQMKRDTDAQGQREQECKSLSPVVSHSSVITSPPISHGYILNENDFIEHNPKQPDEGYIHMECGVCGQSIEVNASASGQDFDCPTCNSKNTVL